MASIPNEIADQSPTPSTTSSQVPHSHGPPVFAGKPAVDLLRQGWYKQDVDSIDDDERELLEKYSGLKPEEVLPHVLIIV